MRNINLFLVLILTTSSFAEEGRLGREPEDYKYTSLGIDIIQAEDSGIGLRLSFKLPGPLYALIERKADGVDVESETYDRIINGFRVGAQSGIGDLLSNVSAKGVNLGIKNIFDVYAELGVKSLSVEGKINTFSENDVQAHAIAGIRFGDSNAWEGKIFIDYSKESEVIQKICPPETVCPLVVEYILAEETDHKYGAGISYNINNRSAFTLEVMSSKVLDSSFKIGYQINF
jgi:hypothetical protein